MTKKTKIIAASILGIGAIVITYLLTRSHPKQEQDEYGSIHQVIDLYRKYW